MKDESSPRTLARLLATLLVIAIGPTVAPAQVVAPDGAAALEIIAAHLSHGIGGSPFDAPIAWDSVAAALVIGARHGAPLHDLRATATDPDTLRAKLTELTRAGLLELRGDSAFATLPILLDGERDAYRRITDAAARRVLQTLRPELESIMTELAGRGWEQWSYHFIWSQLFDSQFAWAELTSRRLVPPLAPPVAWIVYPRHEYMSGTNYYPDDEIGDWFLPVTWTPDGANTIAAIGDMWRDIFSVAIGGDANPDILRRLEGAGLGVAPSAGPAPVLRADDPLCALLAATAKHHVDAVVANLPDGLAAFANGDRQLGVAMAYHDVSWEILALLNGEGRLERPVALRPGADPEAPMAGVAAIVATYPPFVELLLEALAAVDGG